MRGSRTRRVPRTTRPPQTVVARRTGARRRDARLGKTTLKPCRAANVKDAQPRGLTRRAPQAATGASAQRVAPRPPMATAQG